LQRHFSLLGWSAAVAGCWVVKLFEKILQELKNVVT
jgi:hypothetical protein